MKVMIFLLLSSCLFLNFDKVQKYGVELVKEEINLWGYEDYFKEVGLKVINFKGLRREADFNGDGIKDEVRLGRSDVVIHYYNKEGRIEKADNYKFYTKKEGDDPAIHELIVVYLPGSSYPSLIAAAGDWTNGFVFALDQKILINRSGVLSVETLKDALGTPVHIVGRGINCEQNKKKFICLYSSYGNNKIGLGVSALYEVFENAEVRNINAEWNLPFPQKARGMRTNGYHMIGGAFLYLDGDDSLDFIMVGQHSDVLVAFGGPSPHNLYQNFNGNQKEYLQVVAPPLEWNIPCAYFVMENEGANPASDFISCYDRYRKTWSNKKIGGPDDPYFSYYHRTFFFKGESNRTFFITSKKSNAAYSLFEIKKIDK